MIQKVIYAWQYVFDHEVSPLRHIPDIATRHMILQILAWMWAGAFSLAVGSYTFLGVSLLGHTFLIGAAAITVGTYTTAAIRPQLFMSHRGKGGEHS